MPLFAAFFGALFSALGAFLVKIFVAKIAIRVVAVTAILGLYSGLLVVFNALIAPLIAQVFANEYGQFLGLLFPPVAGTILAMLLGFYLTVKTYQLQARAIALTAGV